MKEETMNRLNRGARTIVLTSAVATLAIAVPASLAASSVTAANGRLTMRCTEILKDQDVKNGGVAGTGHCTLTGAISDKGRVTDYRRMRGNTARIRRVVVGRKGTITFLITINLSTGSEPWSIASGAKAYRGLHGRGTQVIDKYYATPAIFVLKGRVSR
jgi:hypothetical protein